MHVHNFFLFLYFYRWHFRPFLLCSARLQKLLHSHLHKDCCFSCIKQKIDPNNLLQICVMQIKPNNVIYRYNHLSEETQKHKNTTMLQAAFAREVNWSLLYWVVLFKNNIKTNEKEHDVVLRDRGRWFLLISTEELTYLYFSFYSRCLDPEKGYFSFLKTLEHQNTSVSSYLQWYIVI